MEKQKYFGLPDRAKHYYPNLVVRNESQHRVRVNIPYTAKRSQAKPKVLQVHLKLGQNFVEDCLDGSSMRFANEIINQLSRELWRITIKREIEITLNFFSDQPNICDTMDEKDSANEMWTIEINPESIPKALAITVTSQILTWNIALNVVGKGGHSSLKPLTVSPVLPVCECRIGAERILRDEFGEYADKSLFLILPKITTTEVKNVIPDISNISGFIQSTNEGVANAFFKKIHEQADSIASKRNVKIELVIQPQDKLFFPSAFDIPLLEHLTNSPVELKLNLIRESASENNLKSKPMLKGHAIIPCQTQSIPGDFDCEKTTKIIAGLFLHRINQ